MKLERLLMDWFTRESPNERDRAFVSELVYGVTRWMRGLDCVIGSVSSRPPKEISRQTLILLRLGAYQLMAMDRTPQHAAVNETVELARSDPSAVKSAGFVNALLREIIRRGLAGQAIPRVAVAENRRAAAHTPWRETFVSRLDGFAMGETVRGRWRGAVDGDAQRAGACEFPRQYVQNIARGDRAAVSRMEHKR